MGWADLLVRLGVRYDSDEGVALGRTVMAFIEEETRVASERLAEARGVFPAWEESIWGPDDSCASDASGERASATAPEAAQLQPDHRRAYRHHLDHRRVQRQASSRSSPSRSCATRRG